MSWHSDSYVGRSYTGDSYLSIAAVELGVGAYLGTGYTAPGYTSEAYNSFPGGDAIDFVAAGLAAAVDVQGFIAGFGFIKQGTGASVSPETYWAGFVADTGGILANDTDPDGDPLSYTIVDQPEAGTLSVYAGGAFEWDPGAAPVGRYSWTYRLFAGGEESDALGTVSIEYGDLFASVGAEGFAAEFGFGFSEQGSAASVLITGFAGELLLTIDAAGTSAAAGCEGFAGELEVGFTARGTRAEVGVSGLAGDLIGSFTQQGTAAVVACEGFAATLDVGVFFSAQGTVATVAVEGHAGTLDTGSFIRVGTAAEVGATGAAGNLRFGLMQQGSTADVDVEAFGPRVVSINVARVRLRGPNRNIIKISGPARTRVRVR